MKTNPVHRHALVFALSAQLSALGFFCACAKRETAVDTALRTQTLHVNNGQASEFDPHTLLFQADNNIARALFEGLTDVDPQDARPVPGVAERWESSADGLTWTFHLRPNARWSNDDPVTARDCRSATRFAS